uniref:Centrosomal protein gamma-tubulin complex protein 3 n=1 Tax=Dugesia japonica TaxID=6161 RepID=A0A872TMT8_DUGJA|nr:centrosomal protein gamma-tubulin complex protein 3 [Dugesia japonica]
MNNNNIIKEELLSLSKRYSVSYKKEDIELQLRKLSCYGNSQIPNILSIELDLEAKMKESGLNESSVLEMKMYINKIIKSNVRDPANLIYFLKEMSIYCDTPGSSKPTFIRPQAIDIRTSTPRSSSNYKPQKNDVSSISSTRSYHPYENNSSRFNSSNTTVVESSRSQNILNTPRSSHNYQISDELSEYTVIGEILFIILGTDGMWLSWNETLQQLSIRNNGILPFSMHEPVLTLCQCGSAYKRIRAYIEYGINNPSIGVVYQGLCVALNDHLASYVNLVADLQSQYNCWSADIESRSVTSNSQIHLTLEILLLKLHEPAEILFFIVNILNNADERRGGQLATTIYSHLLHGTPDKVKLTRNLLLHAVEPFYNFIQQWIYDGVLDESHQEFFVAISTDYNFNFSWTEKYGLRKGMIPSFITESEAQKILLTGKSINFLREVCGDKTLLKEKKEIADTMAVSAESMVNQMVDRSFENMINSVYVVTSSHLLKVMFEKYSLMDHLKALRKYMLHGQGDFILRMMEIIGPELSKPANELRVNHFEGPLSSAVKSTNAQYDSQDIIDRVQILFMKMSENECGWDVFTLNYNMKDVLPLNSVVSRSSFSCYLRAFNMLLRSRRVHYILNSFFIERNSSHKSFNKITEISSVLHLSHTMVVDMRHFVNQIQYYINFEVLECSWKTFIDSIKKSTDLDSVMKHHEYFLKEVTSGCLLEPDTRELLANLRTIYELIINFETILTEMFSKFHEELRFRLAYQELNKASLEQKTWGVEDKREKKEQERMMHFTKYDILKFHNKLKAHNTQYESSLIKFLSTIIDHRNSSLRCLYANLDFNGRYRDRIREHRRKL